MDFIQLPIMQGGAVVVLLAVLWLIFTGRLVPRSTLDDVRADRDARIADAEKDTERAWHLYEMEQTSHALTRKALLDQALGMTAPALAVAETTEKILSELSPGSVDG
ncbi:hypothetical protein ACFWYW_55680 [Nonomuraea sp. NPDC059023]|uniref:hypothetical protein n=1 Tax=unclassified Nonomuraea TaxID=2593643 RepID=UPI0036A74C45